jgi:hypothetical protein
MKKISSLLALAGLFVIVAVNCGANTVVERFSTDPLQNGWQIFGDTNLFAWNSTNQNLDVTWDSSQTNSYFYLPLGRTYTQADGFCLQFDLNLKDTDATGYFQLAIGLCNFAEATGPDFSRANGYSPDLCEFDYFPDGPNSYGPSIDATLADSADSFYFSFDTTQPMLTNTDYRVVLIHRAGEPSVSATIYTNGQPFTHLPSVYNGSATNNFNLDTLAICNYTTLDDIYGDTLLAHGTVGKIAVASPLPVDKIQTAAPGQIKFASDTNWLYTLEQTTNFQNWSSAASPVFGNGTNLLLQATNTPADKSFYRVRADLP